METLREMGPMRKPWTRIASTPTYDKNAPLACNAHVCEPCEDDKAPNLMQQKIVQPTLSCTHAEADHDLGGFLGMIMSAL